MQSIGNAARRVINPNIKKIGADSSVAVAIAAASSAGIIGTAYSYLNR